MEEDEYRGCKKCFTKTKQEIIFMPEIPTYKKEDSTNAECGQTSWLQ